MITGKIVIAIAALLAVGEGPSHAGDDRWFFTASEIAAAYRYQEQFGGRLSNPLKPEQCYYGEQEFAASQQKRQFTAPCRFITETIRQLRELLGSGAAKYLFPLDVDRASFAVPRAVWEAKYKKLPSEKILHALLLEPTLVAVYTTALHLDRAPSNKESGTSGWGKRRTVVGFYDGRPNQLLARRLDGKLYSELAGFVQLGGFTLMGHFLGELTFVAGESVVMFDISFDDDRAAAPVTNIVSVSARAK